tara:strand:- start:1403 stop:2620 length:1218 start_codon:yes stop_codon:yes gene_type:complete
VHTKNIFKKNHIQKNNLINFYSKLASKNFLKIIKRLNKDIFKDNKTINILDKNFKFNFKVKDLKRFDKYKNIAVIGMGGSILGLEAIELFLKKKIKKKIHFFDNIDIEKIIKFKKEQNFKKTLFLIISKSGDTIETLSNFFSLNVIKKNAKNIIIISERKNNSLFEISKKYNLFYVEHKSYVGGRYSVLSEVGILPSILMGIKINSLRQNLERYFKKKEKVFLKDSVLKMSNLLNNKKYKNIILLNYAPELEKFLYWYQQLVAESLGKNTKGFLPIVSSAPKDHHSLLQLYLDGPKDKLFYIFSSKINEKIKINAINFPKKTNFLNKKTLSKIKNAQKNSLIFTLKKYKIPFREFEIKKRDEATIGELFGYFITETILIGMTSKINPFDQPAVEEVKVITRKFLK